MADIAATARPRVPEPVTGTWRVLFFWRGLAFFGKPELRINQRIRFALHYPQIFGMYADCIGLSSAKSTDDRRDSRLSESDVIDV